MLLQRFLNNRGPTRLLFPSIIQQQKTTSLIYYYPTIDVLVSAVLLTPGAGHPVPAAWSDG